MRDVGEKQNKHLWVTVAALSVAVVCWGLWTMLKPYSTAQLLVVCTNLFP
jgi:uncharacterized membrane protein HdeD (DUF308 family)